jgi:hypothetical protein
MQAGRQRGGAPPGQAGQAGQAGRQVIVLPEPADVGKIIIRGASDFAKRHKVVTGGYVLGILVIILIGGGSKLNYDQRREYNNIMNTIDVQAEYDASNDFFVANQNYRATKGWFSCDGLCQRNKRKMDDAKIRLDKIRKEGNVRMSDAKNVAGLFSEIGVGEVQGTLKDKFVTTTLTSTIVLSPDANAEMFQIQSPNQKRNVIFIHISSY